ncbi:MAG: DNA recombination protein RmuC, partial [Tannerellaceae bacterium]
MTDILLIANLLGICFLIFKTTRQSSGGDDIKKELEDLKKFFENSFERVERNFREDFKMNRDESRHIAKESRETLSFAMKEFTNTFERSIETLTRLQKEQFLIQENRQNRLIDNTEKRLDEIKVTVDEKLQKTLNERIG